MVRTEAEAALASGKPKRSRGFKEVQARIAADPLAALFAAYGHACAFTGRSLREEAADPRGYLLVLGPDPLTVDPKLLIPASLDAIHAYERGHLALGPRYNFLVDMEMIAPELVEALNPLGRLNLPSDASSYPSLAAMTGHLIAFMRGRPST